MKIQFKEHPLGHHGIFRGFGVEFRDGDVQEIDDGLGKSLLMQYPSNFSEIAEEPPPEAEPGPGPLTSPKDRMVTAKRYKTRAPVKLYATKREPSKRGVKKKGGK